jgi:hypothetical protein
MSTSTRNITAAIDEADRVGEFGSGYVREAREALAALVAALEAALADAAALRSEVDQWRALGLDIVDARRLLSECESALKIVRAREQVERGLRIAAEAEVTRLRADIIEVVADLPHPVEGACSTRPEAEPEAVRLRLLAALGGGR